MSRKFIPDQEAKDAGYRSGLEYGLAQQLVEMGVSFEYETRLISYLLHHNYKPDLILPNGVIIEAKGRFTADDRRKHLAIKDQHPDLDIRFVFNRSKSKLRKGAKSTYADWCNKNGFLFADKIIPEEWVK